MNLLKYHLSCVLSLIFWRWWYAHWENCHEMVTSIKMLVEVVVVDGCLVMLLLLSLIFLLSIKKRAIMARPSSLGVKSVYCVKWNAVIYDFPSLVFVCVCQKELFLVGKLVSLFYYYSLISPVSPTFCLGSSPLFRLDPTLNVFLTEFWILLDFPTHLNFDVYFSCIWDLYFNFDWI